MAFDYTNLTGTVTFASGELTTNISVGPVADNLFEGDETLTLTLLTNRYFLDSNYLAATILVRDVIPTNLFVTVASGFSTPVGIDYSGVSDSLIVSAEGGFNGQAYSFARIYTNLVVSNSVVVTNVVVTNCSGISGLSDEVKLTTVKANAGGFTNGDLYFGSSTGIGWLSVNAAASNLNWCILTNQVETNALLLRGSLCVDQTGTFSNHVIAVTSDDGASVGSKGIWQVDAQAHPALLARIDTFHLEGVITLTNDLQKWGPWAGKIITGDEHKDPPLIYTIATNGNVAIYDTTVLIPGGIHPEDFDIIPPNQNLYACDPNGTIMKLSSMYLTNFVGDLLITDAGEVGFGARLFIVHWDAATTNFLTRRIPYIVPGGSSRLEHVTFAPIEFPEQ